MLRNSARAVAAILTTSLAVSARCGELTPGPVLTRAAMGGMPTALGRAAETHELVDVILFMCSENASFVTGSNHVIDGGRLCMYQPYVAPKEAME